MSDSMSQKNNTGAPQAPALEGFEEEEAFAAKLRPPKRPVKYENLPADSLQFLADGLGKSTRQVRRYCVLGLVEGAYRKTKKGHWRVSLTPETLDKTRGNIARFERREKRLENYKAWQEHWKDDGKPFLEELPFDVKYLLPARTLDRSIHDALRDAPRGSFLFAIIAALTERGQQPTVEAIAKAAGVSQATLYRWFPRGKLGRFLRTLTVDSRYLENLQRQHVGPQVEEDEEADAASTPLTDKPESDEEDDEETER